MTIMDTLLADGDPRRSNRGILTGREELHLIATVDPGMAAVTGAHFGGEPDTSALFVVGAGGRAVRLEATPCIETPG